MPLDEWPGADRAAWQYAVKPGSLLDEGGTAAGWRDGGRKPVVQAYGRFLAFLKFTGRLDDEASPAERITWDHVVAFGEQLQEEVASETAAMYIAKLAAAAMLMAPGQEWGWLDKLAANLGARAKPSRDKRGRVVPAEALLDLGLRMMEDARSEPVPPCRRTMVGYRNGLIIAFLASIPTRSRSLLALTVTNHLVRLPDRYRITWPAADMKSGRPYEVDLPGYLTEAMDHYLAHVRGHLLGKARSDALWITWDGTPMSARTLYDMLVRLTGNAFGVALGSHLFRDCAATSIALEDPEHAKVIAPVLGHATHKIAEDHYNQAQSTEASRRQRALVEGKRRTYRRERRRRGRSNT